MIFIISWFSYYPYFHHHDESEEDHCTDCCSHHKTEIEYDGLAITKAISSEPTEKCPVCSFLKHIIAKYFLKNKIDKPIIFAVKYESTYSCYYGIERVYNSNAREPPLKF